MFLVSILQASAQFPKNVSPGILQVGMIQGPSIQESSGVIASRQHPGVFWTHNDGKKEHLYAIDRTGKPIAEFRLRGVQMVDWEDIAIDSENRLHASDTGNNRHARREVAVHRFAEPDPKSTEKFISIQQSWRLAFPGDPFDSEALFVHGTNAYLVSKVTDDQRAGLYRFPLAEPKGVITLELVGRLRIDSPVTAADISPDGNRLAVLAKNGPYVFTIHGDVAKATHTAPAHKRFRHESIEACTFTPEGLLVTAESREIYLFTDEIFRAGK
jgi:hypothetical protein